MFGNMFTETCRFYMIDAFTNKPFHGNAVAVVPLTGSSVVKNILHKGSI